MTQETATSDTVPEIRAVLFDFGLVLSRGPEPAAWARMLATTGLDESALHAGYWAHRHAYDRGTLTGPAYWHAVGLHANTPLDTAQVEALIAADTDLWTDMNVPMVDWARQLQRAGTKTGILSNIGDSIAEGICAKLPWLSAFDHCTWSHALRMAKPEPAIYIETASSLGVEPPHILFIDDRADNIAAAHAVGMQAIQYTDHPAFEHEMRRRGFGWLLDAGAASAAPRIS